MDRRALLAVIVAVIILGGAIVYHTSTQGSYTPVHRTFAVQITGSTMDPEELSAKQDDTITLRVRADSRFELHLHGYDRTLELEPGRAHALTLKAGLTGRFTIENEDSGTELGALTVEPA